MRIAYIGKFKRLYDEEYIARSFESLGHEVCRVNEKLAKGEIIEQIENFKPDIVLWAKLSIGEPQKIREYCSKYTTICWVFDLYFGYQREARLYTPAFTADYIFTTDGGHEEEFKKIGNHYCVRQGIYKPDCYVLAPNYKYDVIFVGSQNPYFKDRNNKLDLISKKYNFKWFGKLDTNEVRGDDLNKLFSETKIVIGDSVPSPKYWSNRIVETLGRGGFLIHREVEGLKEEYPDLVTYDGTIEDLYSKIDYYLEHEEERLLIIKKNFELVKNKYTMEDNCKELLSYVKI